MQKSRNELRDLIHDMLSAWVSSKGAPNLSRALVVFIDDLDRCSNKVIVKVCEAVKLYLDAPGLIFVIACDQSVLARGTDAAIESAPWYGAKHGKDELVTFFQGIARTGPVTEFTPLAFAGNDDGDVPVFIRYAFTVTATGKHVAMNMHHYWKFRDGRACFVRSSEDTAQVTAALTP